VLKASVIIPTFNRKAHLLQTLDALMDQTALKDAYEIIVCDDGSDEKLDAVSGIKLLRLKKQGAASARNQGILQAQGEILIFLDADMVVNKDFIQKHIAFHQDHKNSLAIGLRLHQNMDGSIQVSDVRKRLLNFLNMSFFEMKSPWFLAYTCHISVPKKDATQELFDPNFILWGLEDVEWAYRLFQKDIRFYLFEDCNALHLYHDRSINDEKFQGWLKNLSYMIEKHPRLKPLKTFIPVFDPSVKADYFLAYDSFEKQL
jgi:glycosyltransferase involved in cell wall biosynthesis